MRAKLRAGLLLALKLIPIEVAFIASLLFGYLFGGAALAMASCAEWEMVCIDHPFQKEAPPLWARLDYPGRFDYWVPPCTILRVYNHTAEFSSDGLTRNCDPTK